MFHISMYLLPNSKYLVHCKISVNKCTYKTNQIYGLSILTDTIQGALVVVVITVLMGAV